MPLHPFPLFLLFASTANAQIAAPSFFPNMKSTNPAVISHRKLGQYTLIGSMSNTDKTTTLSQAKGSPIEASVESNIKIKGINFFRGGTGPTFATEFSADLTSGVKKDTIEIGESPLTFDNNVNSYYGNAAFGFAKFFGLSVAYVSYAYKMSVNQSFGGVNLNATTDIKLKLLSLRPGLVLDLGMLSFGGYYDYIKITGQNNQSLSITGGTPEVTTTTQFDPSQIIGAAAALKGTWYLLEAGYEIMPFEGAPAPGQPKDPTPAKISGAFEIKIGKLGLGIKTNFIKNVFKDIDKIVPSQLLFGNMAGSSRLENIINFAYGDTKGFAISGAAFYSKFNSEEFSDLISTTSKQEVSTKSLGGLIKLGYGF